MSTARVRLLAGYSVVVALLAGTAAAIGITQRGSGATAEATSILGERYSYAIDGVYAHNAVRVVAEGVGWDAVTLFLAVPALLVAAVFVARGSLRARLAALGLFGYLAYQYLMYAMFWAVGPLFPLFVVLYPAALLGLALAQVLSLHGAQVAVEGRWKALKLVKKPSRAMPQAQDGILIELPGGLLLRVLAGQGQGLEVGEVAAFQALDEQAFGVYFKH